MLLSLRGAIRDIGRTGRKKSEENEPRPWPEQNLPEPAKGPRCFCKRVFFCQMKSVETDRKIRKSWPIAPESIAPAEYSASERFHVTATEHPVCRWANLELGCDFRT